VPKLELAISGVGKADGADLISGVGKADGADLTDEPKAPTGSDQVGQSDWVSPSSSNQPGSVSGVQNGMPQANAPGWINPGALPPQMIPPSGPAGKPPERGHPAATAQLQPGPGPGPGRGQAAPISRQHGAASQAAGTPPLNTANIPGQHPAQQSHENPASGSHDVNQRLLSLNNQAVVLINDNNYEAAIKKLEEALKIDPTYKHGRENLAIAYNNYGLQLKSRPDEAIKVFHKAFALDPTNEKTRVNLDTIILFMGRNPKSFKDRLDLGNKAVAHGDFHGARIEYEAALAIKQDPIVHQKLQALLSGGDPTKVEAPLENPEHNPPPAQNSAPPVTSHQKPGHHKPPPGPPPGKTTQTRAPAATADGAHSGVSQKLDTMYRNLKNLETKAFGKTFETDDVLSRLSRLEQKLIGKPQAGNPMRRLDALLLLQ
jgi:tetratricopeptide (TPR) repeat protein